MKIIKKRLSVYDMSRIILLVLLLGISFIIYGTAFSDIYYILGGLLIIAYISRNIRVNIKFREYDNKKN